MADEEPEAHRPRRASVEPTPSSPPAGAHEPTVPLSRGADFADSGSPGASRSRTALVVAAVAAVVVLGLVVLYTVVNLTRESAASGGAAPSPAGSSSPTASASASASPSDATAPAILSDTSMITPAAAKTVASGRTWKVALTQKGRSADSPGAACLGGDPAEGQPTPQQTVLRLLSSDGQDPPALLHQADAYQTPEEAAQAFGLSAKALGSCTMPGGYISAGKSVAGLGDQATGLVVTVLGGAAPQFHSLVLVRTGRVVDVVDVAQPKQDVAVGRVAAAGATAVSAQCSVAGGSCAAEPTVKNGPPPLGGDRAGFLATGDLPPVGKGQQTWVADTPSPPSAEKSAGSGCETVSWARVSATTRLSRTYLLQDNTGAFGLDEVLLTTGSDSDAKRLVDRIKRDWASCPKRQLTATVPSARSIRGVGAQDIEVSGWVTTVTQKSGSDSARYRVGIVRAGNKVVFTVLTPERNLDLTDEQFDLVAVRAGQRASQTR